eukprot:CAMPEP_0113479096 /NCGR_PEP_ID=MMETSP0014_2-20120614/21123_1 /TAXON_ID=2857 /ORGANISM="Nitzschia sp." /LENGTH=794 /DNA_ID=CAMNT_0000372363 /DNA_START=985 /DNA_END=3369 /DNA_ORIENTATION=- /assembly_acc=CAM_ASM_000159
MSSPTTAAPAAGEGDKTKSARDGTGGDDRAAAAAAAAPDLYGAPNDGGDVAVVQPSFDEGTDGRSPSRSKRTPPPASSLSASGRRGHHVRNLSEHFEDATKLNTSPPDEKKDGGDGMTVPANRPADGEARDPSASAQAETPPQTTTTMAGQKHQRTYSEDDPSPAVTHRRIDSIGNSASVNKRDHRRIDSSGLDALSAAVHYQKELAEVSTVPKPWESSAAARPNHDAPVQPGASAAHPRHYPPQQAQQPPPSSYYGYTPSHNPPYHHPSYPPYYTHPPPAHNVYPPSHHVAYHPSMSPHHPGYPVQYARGGPPPPPGAVVDPYGKPPPPHAAPLQQPYLERPTSDGAASTSIRRASTTVSAINHGDSSTTDGSQVASGQHPSNKETIPEEAAAKTTTSTATNTTPIKKEQGSGNDMMSPPVPVSKGVLRFNNGGSTQGVQTYVTAISVGDGGRTVQPGFPADRPPFGQHRPTGSIGDASVLMTGGAGHHRKMSSFSALAPIIFGEATEHPLKRGSTNGSFGTSVGPHHRTTSSTVSFLNSLEVTLDNSDAAFMRNLQAQTGEIPGGVIPPLSQYSSTAVGAPPQVPAEQGTATKRSASTAAPLATGGTSKRVRRKCTIEGCENRVVQGGLCIAHGAKRKICKHPGCTKHVKKAGFCSTHGPARKRCDSEGCTKVAVQGGKCIAHGAKKKLCAVADCKKQAILGGMCKKHHDQNQQESGNVCKVIEPKAKKKSKSSAKPAHQRGLSIFQEMSVEDLAAAAADVPPGTTSSGVGVPPASGHRHRSTFSQQIEKIV